MAEKPTPVYDESKIKTLSSLEHIRLRTGHIAAAPAEKIWPNCRRWTRRCACRRRHSEMFLELCKEFWRNLLPLEGGFANVEAFEYLLKINGTPNNN